MNPVSARLLAAGLIAPPFTAPHEAVQWMGAMQAQDYRMMRWAVGMRTKNPSARAFEQDYNAGRMLDGQVAGNWSPKAGQVQVAFFSPEITAAPAALQAEIGRYQDFARQ